MVKRMVAIRIGRRPAPPKNPAFRKIYDFVSHEQNYVDKVCFGGVVTCVVACFVACIVHTLHITLIIIQSVCDSDDCNKCIINDDRTL